MGTFSHWTAADVARFNSKSAKQPPPDDAQGLGEPVMREADIHQKIIDECKKRQWIALHGSMAQASGRTIGEWDFTIVASRGRVYFIECKTKEGKWTTEQLGMREWAKSLGHFVYECRSFERFLEIVDQPQTLEDVARDAK